MARPAVKYSTDSVDLDQSERSVILPSDGIIDTSEIADDFANQFEIVEETSTSTDSILEQERFMNEKIKVILQSDMSEDARQVETVTHQGICQSFFRNVVMEVRRKFVHVLIAAKRDVVTTEEVYTGGEKRLEVKIRSMPLHSVQIVEDRSPKAFSWLQEARNEVA